MKKVIFLFFFLISGSFYGQNDTISIVKNLNLAVISADKMNVVYRGIQNPISISVNNCKSFTVRGNGIFRNLDGTYQLVPSKGLETTITIKITLNDDSIKVEEHKFRIKNIPRISGAINGLVCNQSIILMSKKELNKALISIDFSKDFLYELKLNLKQFTVKIGDKNIVIEGTKFNKEVLDIIDKLPLNSVFEIEDLKSNIYSSNFCFAKIIPIKIMIVEDNNYVEYEEDKE